MKKANNISILNYNDFNKGYERAIKDIENMVIQELSFSSLSDEKKHFYSGNLQRIIYKVKKEKQIEDRLRERLWEEEDEK